LSLPLFVVVAGFAASVALNIQLEDRRVMNEPVYGGDGHAGVREDVIPAGERLVGRYQKTSPLIPFGDQFEQDARFRLILPDVGQVVE
jgi:hypothetical protein